VNGIFGYGDRATESRGMLRSVCDVSSQVGRRAELAIAVRSAMIGEQLDRVAEASHRIFADVFESEIALDEVGECA
jgi:hypothetical protein